jgi:hypothetical protein
MSIFGGQRKNILAGLVRVLMLEARQMGLNRWYMMLPESLHRLLCDHGFRPRPVAGACSCAEGLPYIIELNGLETLLFAKHGPYYDFLPSMPATCPTAQKRKPSRIAHLY